MSWSITVNNLQQNWQLVWRQDIIEQFISQHPSHALDLEIAVKAAKELGLNSATLAGGRTSNPYGNDEVVTLTITGLMEAQDFNATMLRILGAGPDAEALEEQGRATDAG